MAKAVAPPCKAPADKGHHIVLNFPVSNVKEQSVKIELNGTEKPLEFSSSVTVSFESFSPTKRYEKVLDLPEAVSHRQWTKNVTSKNLSIILFKASNAPPPSPNSKSSSAAAAAPPSPVLLPTANGDCEWFSMSPRFEEMEKAPAPQDEETEEDRKEANGQDGAGKKKKKNKPRKKAKGASKIPQDASGEEEEEEDEGVAAATAELEKVVTELQDARSKLQAPKKELEAADAQWTKAGEKCKHFEAELAKWQKHYLAEIKKWQAEQQSAEKRKKDSEAKLAAAKLGVESMEVQAEKLRTVLREAEASAKDRQRLAAEKEDLQRQEFERQAAEEKKQEQEERRKRLEEERLRASEEKKRKEAERKENAARRESERKKQEEEEERLKAERRAKSGKVDPKGAANPIQLQPGAQKKIAKLLKESPSSMKKMVEEASAGKGGAATLLCLAQCLEDERDYAASGEMLLKTLAHHDVNSCLATEKERTDLSMKAMALLKDSPDKVRECMPLLDKLAPKYSILGMGKMMVEGGMGKAEKSSKGSADAKASVKPPPKVEEPWTGPLIEEVEDFPPDVDKFNERHGFVANGKPPACEVKQQKAAVGAPKAIAPSGWVLDEEADGEGPTWRLELPVPSIASLAEVNLDISGDAILLTLIEGGAQVARAMVPSDADFDEANAKWSKKKRVLTIKMPQVA